MSVETLFANVKEHLIQTASPEEDAILKQTLEEALQLASISESLKSGSDSIDLVIPEFSGDKVKSGWIVYMSTYASWCKKNKVPYNAKECGTRWKNLSEDERAQWQMAGGNSPKSGKRSTKAMVPTPNATTSDVKKPTLYNCSNFFHKFVASCANPSKAKGQTPTMTIRSLLWNVEKDGDMAKTYWKDALGVWENEGRPDIVLFAQGHADYVQKIIELAQQTSHTEIADQAMTLLPKEPKAVVV